MRHEENSMTSLTLDAEPVVFEHNGNVLVSYCFNLMFYSVNLSTPEQKKAVLQIFDEYMSVYGSRMTWTTNPTTGAWKKLNGNVGSYMTPHDWLLSKPEDEGFSFLYHGGKKRTDASDITILAQANPDYSVNRHNLSTFSCRFPLKDVAEGSIDLPALMQHWSSVLQPHHAHGGLFAGKWYDDMDERPLLYGVLTPLLMLYPGLQFESEAEGLYNRERQTGLYDGPWGADWLVALSDAFLDKLGGLRAVAANMSPYPVLPYEGGAVLQAGDMAGLGADGDPASLPAYLHLGRVIEPIRAKNIPYVLYLPAQGTASGFKYAPELTDKWCSRFSGIGSPAQSD